MQYDEENRECRPLGVNEAEAAWLDQMSKYRTAMQNDIYSNGGLLDSTTKFGYMTPQVYGGISLGKDVLEREFTYEELAFISRCRLPGMTVPDIDRLISLIKKYKEKLIAANVQQQTLQPGYSYRQVPAPTPYYTYNGTPYAWLEGTPGPISEPEEKKRGRKPKKKEDESEDMPSFLGGIWGDPKPVRKGRKKDDTESKTETTEERNDQVDALTESEKAILDMKGNNETI